MRALGETRAARELDEDTLPRRRRVLGDDHPATRKAVGRLTAEDGDEEDWDEDDEEMHPENMPHG